MLVTSSWNFNRVFLLNQSDSLKLLIFSNNQCGLGSETHLSIINLSCMCKLNHIIPCPLSSLRDPIETQKMFQHLGNQIKEKSTATECLATECPFDPVPSDRVPRDPVPRLTECPMVIECLVTRNQFKSNQKVVASYCSPSSGAWKENLV